MTGWRLFWELRRRGVRLRVVDGKIQAAGTQSEADRSAIREHRTELLRLIDADALAGRYVDAMRAGGDLPTLATVDRADLAARLASFERRRTGTEAGKGGTVDSASGKG